MKASLFITAYCLPSLHSRNSCQFSSHVIRLYFKPITPLLKTETTMRVASRLLSPATVYKRSSHPTSVPLNKLFSNNFPLLVPQSVADYNTFQLQREKFQDDLLSLLPFYPSPDISGRRSEIVQTPVDSKGNYINEFVIYPPGPPKKHLIMVHGYGAGLGFFLKNLEPLAMDGWCIHAIDLLGYGYSSRPSFSKISTLTEVESWFHDSFKTWVQKRGLNKNVLVMAHSMGAYLMATYALKNPDFCKKLIMCSPGAVIKHTKQPQIPEYFKKLWEQNISPFLLVRAAGPLGSKLVSGWSHRRFAKLSPEELELLHRYLYGIFNAPGSGEYMLNFLLAPGADARHPLVDRDIQKLKPLVDWWYGKEDWMDIEGGKICANMINDKNGSVRSKVIQVEDSGHHVYLDNFRRFNEMMRGEMASFGSDT